MDILIKGCALLDKQEPRGLKENQDIEIQGNRISSVTPSEEGKSAAARVIDGRDKLVIPGLINAHTHSTENLLKGTTDRLPLEPWLAHLFGTRGEFTPRDIYLGCMVGAIEMLKSGTTAVLDHMWPGPSINLEWLSAAMAAYRDAGIRAALAPLIDDQDRVVQFGRDRGHRLDSTYVGRRHQGQPPLREMMDRLKQFFRSWHNSENGRLRCYLGPAGVQWCSASLLEESLSLVRQFGAGLHTHLMETRLQSLVCHECFGKSAVAFLNDEGLLGSDVSFAHSVWLDDDDIRTIAVSGAQVVHNPASNLKLGSGLAPIRRMLDAGVTVALGADGSASSDNQVMFDALKLAGLIHNVKEVDADRWVSAREAFSLATRGGATVMGHSGDLGVIAPGALADLVLLDLKSIHWVPLNDPFRQLVFCETGRSVHTVIVDGQVVVEGGLLLTVEEEEIVREVRAKRWPSQGETSSHVEETIRLFKEFQQPFKAHT